MACLDAGALRVARARSRPCGRTRRWRRWARRWRGRAPCASLSAAATARAPRSPANGSSRSKAKRRCRPGAMPQAICAASMAMVPEPQQGSCSAPPASGVPRQPAAASMAAASVSFSGASPLSSRQPRLNSDSPELSTYSVARLGAEVQHQRQVGVAGVDAGALAGGLAQLVADRVLDAQRGEVQALSGDCAARWCPRAACAAA